MNLPERLQSKPFVEWNYIVHGIVTAWELACILGVQAQVEARLLHDADGRLTERLGRLAHVKDTRLLRVYLHWLATSPPTAASRPYSAEGPGPPSME